MTNSPNPPNSSNSLVFKPPAAFIRALGETGFPRARGVQEFGDLSIYYLDLTRLKILSGPETPFVISRSLSGHTRVDAKAIDALLHVLISRRPHLAGDFVVVVIGGEVDDLPDRLRVRLRQHRIVVLDARDLSFIESLQTKDERDAHLVSALIPWLSRRTLSPYQHGEPAYGERFFGRKVAIEDALHSRARGIATFAGCRRIGKTSVLREIRRRLQVEFGDRLRTAEIYGSDLAYKKTSNVLVAIVEQLFTGQPDVERLATDPDLERKFASTIWLLSDRVPKDSTRLEIAVFIDEVDELIEADEKQEYALFRTLRSAFQGRDHYRLFFAGFRRVMNELATNEKQIHNFGRPILLEGLSKTETASMIEMPLRALQVDITDDLVSFIYQDTRGRPELIQLYCAELIAAADEGCRPLSTADLLARVVNSATFRTKISNTFLNSASDLEQLLCFLLVSRMETTGVPIEEYEFSLREADDLLVQCRLDLEITEIEQLLMNLRLLSIIEPSGGRYRLAVPALVTYIQGLDVRHLTRKALRRINNSSGIRRSSPGTIG